jgi:hypothetical protein
MLHYTWDNTTVALRSIPSTLPPSCYEYISPWAWTERVRSLFLAKHDHGKTMNVNIMVCVWLSFYIFHERRQEHITKVSHNVKFGSEDMYVIALKTPWPEPENELYRPSDRRLSAKLVSTLADKGCHVVSVADPYGRIHRFSRPEPLLFLSSRSSTVLKKLGGPHSRPTTSQKIWSRRESNPDLWICSQEP